MYRFLRWLASPFISLIHPTTVINKEKFFTFLSADKYARKVRDERDKDNKRQKTDVPPGVKDVACDKKKVVSRFFGQGKKKHRHHDEKY